MADNDRSPADPTGDNLVGVEPRSGVASSDDRDQMTPAVLTEPAHAALRKPAQYVVKTSVVSAAIRQIGGMKIHPAFVGYLMVKHAAAVFV